MADTIQLVTWELEQTCTLRPNVSPSDSRTRENPLLSKARAYSKGLRDNNQHFGVFGDIYVSSYTYGELPGKAKGSTSPIYPSSGFIVSKEFESVGGPEALFEMCARCPANIAPHEIAGCFGSLDQRPDSPETEEQIRSIIERLGLAEEMNHAFPATTPIWYGLWAVSPVTKSALALLRILISEMYKEDKLEMEVRGNIDQRYLTDFANFVKAAEIAEQRELRLHVRLLPLGHTDFGIYTIFPHCPFCKAPARTARWRRKYPNATQTCHVCGTGFSPSETASAVRMKLDRPDLRDLLGDAAFCEFARDYLIQQGHAPELAEAIVVATEAGNKERERKRQEQAERNRREHQYVCNHLYAGLEKVPPIRSELEEDEEGPGEDSSPWFDLKNFTEVLRRAVALDIRVIYMIHHSSDGELDRNQSRPIPDPLAVLERWNSDGCRDKFTASFDVPDALIESK